MKLRMMQTRLAVGLCAAGILSLSVSSAWAFSRENVSPGDGGNYTFNDPNDKLTDPDNHSSGQSARPFGSNGPAVQFGIQQGPLTPVGRSNGTLRTPIIGRLTATDSAADRGEHRQAARTIPPKSRSVLIPPVADLARL